MASISTRLLPQWVPLVLSHHLHSAPNRSKWVSQLQHPLKASRSSTILQQRQSPKSLLLLQQAPKSLLEKIKMVICPRLGITMRLPKCWESGVLKTLLACNSSESLTTILLVTLRPCQLPSLSLLLLWLKL